MDCHALAGAGKSWAEPERDVDYDVSRLFERAAGAGIDRHCIHAARNPTYEAANRRVAELCRRYPGRLIGFAVHHPRAEEGRIRQMLTEEVRRMGLRGVRSDGAPTRELVEAAGELGLPVLYYPRMNAGQGAARWYHMLASTYPKVNFILPHLGQFRSLAWWAHMEALDLVKRYPNVYVDTSGVGSFKYLEMAVRDIPIERILFGTCAPELDPRVEMEAIRLLKLPEQRQAKLAGGNLLRLLPKE